MTSAKLPDTDLDRELRDMKAPAPPEGLAAKIKAEIPSSSELAAAATTSTPARQLPWLRLAATIAIAALAGTVAWQTMKVKEVESVAPPAGVAERALDDVDRQAAPPPPPAAPAKRSPKPEEKLLVKEEGRDDLAANATATSPSPSLSRRELENAAPAQPVEIVQPVVVPEIAPAAPKAQRPKDKSRDAAEAGVEGGALGYVTGGVAGGVPGGIAGVEAAAPAAAAAASPRSAADHAVAYDGRRANEPVRRRAEVDEERPAAQPDTMIFRDAGVNRFVVTADDRLSTFALDVDTGSYTLARSYLERGTMPPPEAIRLEEFVNAMKYSDRPPAREDFALFAEGGDSPYPDAAGLTLVRFAVQARDIQAERRKPANLTFVVDVSGSMDRENRLGLVKRALGLLLDELTPEDRVGLVVYGTNGRVLLRHTHDLRAIRSAIAQLVPEGSTNAEEGLRLAYDLADEGWVKGEINRIILCSDGVANVGLTGPEAILTRIGEQARRGIQLTTVGFGMGNYNDALMERLADQGDGSYHYVDQLDEARKVFVENLTGTLQHVARDAKIQVEWNPRAVERWRLLGYENRNVADRDFRNDAVDAGEVGAGQAATALYEVRLREGVSSSERIATLNVRWKSVDGKEVRELSRELRAGDVRHSLERGNRDLRLAALAAMFAERLKGTRAGVEVSWSELAGRAGDLASDFPRDEAIDGLADLVDRAARVAGVNLERDGRRGPLRERDDRDDRDNGRLDEPR